MWPYIQSIIEEKLQKGTRNKYKSLNKKLESLSQIQTQTPHKKHPFHPRVTKNTDISFSNTEISLLQKGPKYNMHAKRRNWIQNLGLEAETANTQLKKLKSLHGAFQYLDLSDLLYSYPNKFPHSSPEAPRIIQMRETSTSEGGNYSPNFASRSVINKNPLGSFTCRKAGSWDILFYFPSEGRHTEDFSDARKIQRLRPGLNSRTRVPVASMLTTRPPKPSGKHIVTDQ
jgi:hypothetical protein